jgi:peptidoglycan/xylan/chitin deacetylase (PgdA/CDA1 family)
MAGIEVNLRARLVHWISRIRIKRWIVALAVLLAGFAFMSRAYTTPILMYHHIDERAQEWKLSVSPESFSRQMEFLKAHQYRVLSLSDYIDRIKNKKQIPHKSVVITFDDGYDNNFLEAFPVLKKMGFPAIIFIQVDGVGRRGYMSWDDIVILLENGIDIGSHTVHHGFLPDLSAEDARNEIYESKAVLESRLQRPIPLFSYPGGGFTPAVRQQVIDAGYLGATATHPGREYPNLDPYALKRIRISRTSDNLFVFWLQLSGFYTLYEEIRG